MNGYMASPFPGMDPYLEGYLWPDVHHELASVIKELLAPQISPKYVARINLYTVSDTAPEEDIGIMYPDVEVLKQQRVKPLPVQQGTLAMQATPVTLRIDSSASPEVRIPVVEIRDQQQNQLVTAIEILSPVNKRRPGLEPYREKRKKLHDAGVHLLEIDLLRRGERPFAHPSLPDTHYMATLVRAGSHTTDIWAFDVQDSLPVLPVPLITPDEDSLLNLGHALTRVYERSLYHLSIDYTQSPPPPSFDAAVKDWMWQLLVAEK